uniref:Transposase domain containing protein n=1 Tax=Haemonchus contortus TaxID=6289 RepID=W6NX50_HAECO
MLHVNHTRERHWVAQGEKPSTEPKADLHEKKCRFRCGCGAYPGGGVTGNPGRLGALATLHGWSSNPLVIVDYVGGDICDVVRLVLSYCL